MRNLPLIALFCFLLCQSKVAWCEPSHRDWASVGSFVYQLQDLDLRQVAKLNTDLVIMDYSHDGSHETRYTSKQLKKLRSGGGKKRLLVAYLSVGEAEDYRYYWPGFQKARRAGWLGPRNRRWPGNYRVNYWDPAWQEITFEYLDHIIDAGFDGVFLDRVDVFEEVRLERGEAKRRMASFVADLAAHARRRGGEDFGFFVQNGEELLQEPGYLELLTGIGRESVYFEALPDRAGIPQSETDFLERTLDQVVAAGKLVLSVDYPRDSSQANWARLRARSRGYLHFAGLRELDCLPDWSLNQALE